MGRMICFLTVLLYLCGCSAVPVIAPPESGHPANPMATTSAYHPGPDALEREPEALPALEPGMDHGHATENEPPTSQQKPEPHSAHGHGS